MGRAIAIMRTDISARELRFIAKRTRDCRVVRRILAIALVLEGVDRATSARSSGMDRQTLRDWVHRYNCGGIAELSDRRGKGAKPRLSPTQQAQFVAWVEAGPNPVKDGVVRWRCADLQARVEDAFGYIKAFLNAANESGLSNIPEMNEWIKWKSWREAERTPAFV